MFDNNVELQNKLLNTFWHPTLNKCRNMEVIEQPLYIYNEHLPLSQNLELEVPQ